MPPVCWRCYARDAERAMYEAEQKRLLYVAATRARDHLVLSLFCGKEDCHATRIRQSLAERPDLARELVVDPTGAPALAPRSPAGVPFSDLPTDLERAAEQHRAEELAFLRHRREL